jgi:hypothetical protein
MMLHLLSGAGAIALRIKQIFLAGAALSSSRKIYVFRYGTTALHALTSDGAGRSLPPQSDPAGWQLDQSVTLRRDKDAPNYELINATLAAINKHGFILTHAAIHPLAGLIANDIPPKSADVGEQSASSSLYRCPTLGMCRKAIIPG